MIWHLCVADSHITSQRDKPATPGDKSSLQVLGLAHVFQAKLPHFAAKGLPCASSPHPAWPEAGKTSTENDVCSSDLKNQRTLALSRGRWVQGCLRSATAIETCHALAQTVCVKTVLTDRWASLPAGIFAPASCRAEYVTHRDLCRFASKHAPC